MNVPSTSTIVMASVSFYVGLYHLLIYLRHKRHREDLTFALLCLTGGLYDVFCTGLYNATSVAEGVQWQRAQFIALALFVPAFIWFASDYTRQKPQRAAYAFSAFYLVALVVQIVDRSSLTWMADVPSIKEIVLPFGWEITYYEATFGPFTTLQSLVGMVAATYILWLGVRFYRQGYKREAIPLLLAMGLGYAAVINDTAVSNGLYPFFYTVEYSYLALILLMAYSLSNTVIQAALAKDELLREKAFSEAVLDSLPTTFFMFNAQGELVRWNARLLEQAGLSAETIKGKRMSDFIVEKDRASVSNTARRVLAGDRQEIEVDAMTPRGPVPYHLTASRMIAEGQIYLLGSGNDITERRRTEESLRETMHALRESEERYRQLYELESDAIFLIDNETGRILEANSAASRMYGYTRAELLTMKNTDLSAEPEDTRRVTQTTPPVPDQIITIPLRFHRRKDGTVFPVEITGRFFTRQDRPVHVAAIRDITARRDAEEALQESEARYRALIESQSDLISRYRPDGVLTFVNDAYCQFYGKTREELVGHSLLSMVAPEFQAQIRKEAETIARVHTPTRGEHLNYTKDGQACWIQWVIQPIVGENGVVAELQAVGRDITRLKQTEEEIRRLNDELEHRVAERTAQLQAANRELEAFAYSVSHDLRAPLRAIDGYSRILVEDYQICLDAEGQRICSVVREEAHRMGALIDDLLAFSRLSRTEMRLTSVNMESLANFVFCDMTTPEERARIDFRLSPLPKALGDPTLIRQVWANLLSNACKFSAKRERAVIQVGYREEAGETIYWVRDDGAGFDMRYADKLFGVFQRLHSEKEFPGTGVGLAIVQRIVHRHGGRVWAESALDRGATFYFTLAPKGDAT